MKMFLQLFIFLGGVVCGFKYSQAFGIRNSVKIVDKNIFLVSYLFRGTRYRILFNFRNGPPRFLCVLDENNNDVTTLVKSYLGPTMMGHIPMDITPESLGCKKLVFHDRHGALTTFENDESVIFDI